MQAYKRSPGMKRGRVRCLQLSYPCRIFCAIVSIQHYTKHFAKQRHIPANTYATFIGKKSKRMANVQ